MTISRTNIDRFTPVISEQDMDRLTDRIKDLESHLRLSERRVQDNSSNITNDFKEMIQYPGNFAINESILQNNPKAYHALTRHMIIVRCELRLDKEYRDHIYAYLALCPKYFKKVKKGSITPYYEFEYREYNSDENRGAYEWIVRGSDDKIQDSNVFW